MVYMHTPSVSSKTNGKATSETGQLLQRQLRAGLIPLAGNIAAVDLSLYATMYISFSNCSIFEQTEGYTEAAKIMCCCRAYTIDRQLLVDAQNVGFQIEQKMRDWQQLPGSLKGMVYELTWTQTS